MKKLTVAELIRKLQECPPGYQVSFECNEYSFDGEYNGSDWPKILMTENGKVWIELE